MTFFSAGCMVQFAAATIFISCFPARMVERETALLRLREKIAEIQREMGKKPLAGRGRRETEGYKRRKGFRKEEDSFFRPMLTYRGKEDRGLYSPMLFGRDFWEISPGKRGGGGKEKDKSQKLMVDFAVFLGNYSVCLFLFQDW